MWFLVVDMPKSKKEKIEGLEHHKQLMREKEQKKKRKTNPNDSKTC